MDVTYINIKGNTMKPRQSTTLIILHCAATREGQNYKASDIKRWHLERQFEDIGYHYVIDLDGTVEKGRDERMVGAHTTGKNNISVGICYVGGCDKNNKPKDTRTLLQKESMFKLVDQMMWKYGLTINDVHCHNEFANKACPSFDIEQFRNEFKEWLHSKENVIICPKCGEQIQLTENDETKNNFYINNNPFIDTFNS